MDRQLTPVATRYRILNPGYAVDPVPEKINKYDTAKRLATCQRCSLKLMRWPILL